MSIVTPKSACRIPSKTRRSSTSTRIDKVGVDGGFVIEDKNRLNVDTGWWSITNPETKMHIVWRRRLECGHVECHRLWKSKMVLLTRNYLIRRPRICFEASHNRHNIFDKHAVHRQYMRAVDFCGSRSASIEFQENGEKCRRIQRPQCLDAFPTLIHDNSNSNLFDESHVRHHKFARDV